MNYDQKAVQELTTWQRQMQRDPSIMNRLAKKVQNKINSFIPEKIHTAITTAIRQMVRGVLFGAKITSATPEKFVSLEITESIVMGRIDIYKKTAAAEGGITGAGGILLTLADFPILLGIKVKLLFDIAVKYGYPVSDYRERLYLLHIFQLAFSSQEKRSKVYNQMINWNKKKENLPEDINQFDWRGFQQEYRDYIDLAKFAQMIPVIGAAVGLIVNYRLIKKLGHTAMNAYRMRLMEEGILYG